MSFGYAAKAIKRDIATKETTSVKERRIVYLFKAQDKITYTSKIGKIEFAISNNEVYTEFSSQDANKIEA